MKWPLSDKPRFFAEHRYCFIDFLTKSINHMFTKRDFSKEIRNSEVFLVYKKEDLLWKENHKPVSFLPHMSKVFERIICKQVTDYMESKLSKVTGF